MPENKKPSTDAEDDMLHAQPIPAGGIPSGFVETYHPRRGKLMVRVAAQASRDSKEKA